MAADSSDEEGARRPVSPADSSDVEDPRWPTLGENSSEDEDAPLWLRLAVLQQQKPSRR